MKLKQLMYVVNLADTAHFKRAAEQSHVSQSTLSMQLQRLEGYLGVKLFDRSTRTVKPTAAGAQILPHARAVLEAAEEIKRIAHETADPLAANIRLGVIPTLGPYYLPHALSTLCKIYPKMRFSLREEMTDDLLDGLEAGRLDAALLALPTDTRLVERSLFDEKFYAAVPAQHPLTRKKTVRASDFEKEDMLLLDEGHCLRDQVLEFCGPNYRKLQSVRATSLETIRHMVAMNMGVSVLPGLAAETQPPARIGGVETLPFAGGNPHRTIGLVWRRKHPLEHTLKAVADALRKHPPKGVRTRKAA